MQLPVGRRRSVRTRSVPGGYAKERTALKKQWQPVNWHWADGAAPLHRL
ncbi:hypothetical protein [Streptomyces laculatispora]|nr:hypothetical protein [Streptomyces laculatispora]MBO0913282.1 hypothetical protein [Streptomyces laculatispora]MCX4775072.1 hypothetical protein [Streptomyces sp. NBC_01285]